MAPMPPLKSIEDYPNWKIEARARIAIHNLLKMLRSVMALPQPLLTTPTKLLARPMPLPLPLGLTKRNNYTVLSSLPFAKYLNFAARFSRPLYLTSPLSRVLP